MGEAALASLGDSEALPWVLHLLVEHPTHLVAPPVRLVAVEVAPSPVMPHVVAA